MATSEEQEFEELALLEEFEAEEAQAALTSESATGIPESEPEQAPAKRPDDHQGSLF